MLLLPRPTAPATEASVESNGAAPANIYAFSKVIMDNIATRAPPANRRIGSSSACVISTFTARAKRTKACRRAWSIILSRQMKAGQRPRIFKHGEQKRDFVYVKDIVEGSIRALDAQGERNLQSRLRPGAFVQRAGRRSEQIDSAQISSRTTSTIRTHIIRISPRPI